MVLETLVYGLVQGAVLMLTALGFSLTFGLSGVPNFAHGGLYILSGYTAWWLLRKAGWPLPLAILGAVALAGLVGAALYRLVIRQVRGVPLAEVIASFAVGVAILEVFRWLGFVSYDFHLPVLVRGSVVLGDTVVDWHRLLLVAAALGLSLGLYGFGRYTRVGLALRALAQEEYTALAVGIRPDWAATVAVALGSALAAVAAVLILPLGIISINLGYDAMMVALAVTVLGGLESPAGMILASLVLGFAMTVTSTYLGPHWTEVIYLVAIIAVLIVRPSGLLGKFKELEERV